MNLKREFQHSLQLNLIIINLEVRRTTLKEQIELITIEIFLIFYLFNIINLNNQINPINDIFY